MGWVRRREQPVEIIARDDRSRPGAVTARLLISAQSRRRLSSDFREMVIVCFQNSIISCRLTLSQIEALRLLPDFRRISQSLYFTPRGVGDRWW